jgi:MFS family permease
LLDDYLREATHDDRGHKSSIKEVVTTWYLRHAVILACCVLILTLSFYPILQSSTYFFQSIDIDSQLAELSSTGLMIVFTVACVLGSFFIDRYPRRTLVITFGALATFFLALFVGCSVAYKMHHRVKYIALGFLYCYAVCFGMVLGPMSWFVGPELVAQRHRSTVFCLCYAINNVLITVTNFASVPLYDVMNAWCLVPLFIIPSVICLIYLYLYLPETLGKETHEIIRAMKKSNNKKSITANSASSASIESTHSETMEESKRECSNISYGTLP